MGRADQGEFFSQAKLLAVKPAKYSFIDSSLAGLFRNSRVVHGHVVHGHVVQWLAAQTKLFGVFFKGDIFL